MSLVQVKHETAIAEVVRLAEVIWTEYYTPLIGEAQVRYMLDKFQSRGAVSRQIGEGCLYYLILDDMGESAGYFALEPRSSEMFLSKLYVAAKRRGLGYAREAVEFAVRQAAARGLRAVTLTVNKGNAPSIAAYQKMGFAVAEPVVADIGGGFVMNDYRMVREVG